LFLLYRKEIGGELDMDKIYIKVEDGMLNKVYSENPNLEVILYDLDQDDPDKFDEVVESWKEVEDRKLTELLDHE
jgi:hypothetical protein